MSTSYGLPVETLLRVLPFAKLMSRKHMMKIRIIARLIFLTDRSYLHMSSARIITWTYLFV